MKTVEIGNITLEVDTIGTEKFYSTQSGFICDCPHCTNYVSKISNVSKSLNGIENELGIDLSKAVGQGMDELMPHDFDNYHLYVVPYYVIGKCYVNGKELKNQSSKPISHVKKISENLSLTIINSTDYIKIEKAENILTIWLEYKTELIKKINNYS